MKIILFLLTMLNVCFSSDQLSVIVTVVDNKIVTEKKYIVDTESGIFGDIQLVKVYSTDDPMVAIENPGLFSSGTVHFGKDNKNVIKLKVSYKKFSFRNIKGANGNYIDIPQVIDETNINNGQSLFELDKEIIIIEIGNENRISEINTLPKITNKNDHLRITAKVIKS